MLLILYFNSKLKLSYSQSNRLFRLIILMTICVFAVDTAAWLLNGQTLAYARAGLWLLNSFYFILTELIAFFWFVYVFIQLRGDYLPPEERRKLAVASLPFLAFLVMLLLTPWLDTIFYIDAQNQYQRGRLFFIQNLVGFGYMLAGTAMALWKVKKEELTEKKREYLSLASFILLPLCGGSLQILQYGLVLLWPLTAVSLLMVYINLQHGQIWSDALTGLNNRRRFDQYIKEHSRAADSWYLIMIDLDDFKKINDTYGHLTGDEALRQTAGLLKKAFGKTNSFLARYGGDEFAVILDAQSKVEVAGSIAMLNAALTHARYHGEQQYTLSLSIGYARYHSGNTGGIEALIARADQQMYRQKEAKKTKKRE